MLIINGQDFFWRKVIFRGSLTSLKVKIFMVFLLAGVNIDLDLINKGRLRRPDSEKIHIPT